MQIAAKDASSVNKSPPKAGNIAFDLARSYEFRLAQRTNSVIPDSAGRFGF